MSKRRINLKQTARIEKNQKNYRQKIDEISEKTTDGLVIKRFSRHALIESPEGRRILCSIRPTIDSLVTGDHVVWQAEGSTQGVVVSRYPRQSMLGRPDKRGQIKPIAVNITQIMIIIAPKPEVSWSLLDSYLVMAEYLNIEACIILNKTDLASDAIRKQLLDEYESLGYSILFTSHHVKDSCKELEKALDNQVSVFVGQSGVGKSSLISQILPLETIQTGAISAKTALGKHTTSTSCLYHLPTGGALIDSPGVREFGLWHMPINEITKGFREFRPYVSECKFRNCSHQNALGCALLEAVKNKLVSRRRYDNYVKISSQFSKSQ